MTWRCVLIGTVIGALLAVAPAVDVDGKPAALGDTGCTERSWVGGTTEWCHGTYVYRDHVYDDDGADTSSLRQSPHGTQLDRATGDVDHREHGQSLNSADLLTLRLSRTPDGNGLHVRFELNTLLPEDRTVAALAIDTDDDDATGMATLGDFGIRADGVDALHVFDGRDAAPADDPALGGVIEGTIPMPPGERWDVYAFTALGDSTVMNVAFRDRERGSWWEDRQAAALAAGDITTFRGQLKPADLGARHDPAQLRFGLHARVHRSAHAIAEGVSYEGVPGQGSAAAFGQAFHYLGRHQPYAIYVPNLAGPRGVQLALHGRSAGHASLISGEGMQKRFGDELGRIIVVPLARGPFGFYSSWSERDVLDALADVEATYPVDRSRVFAGGYSMGGYGALRLAALFPDRFAGVVNWVGYTGDCLNGVPGADDRCPGGALGNVADLVGNLRHVPAANLYAAADELVHAHTGLDLQRRFEAAGNRHVFWMHAAEHLTLALLDDWRKESRWTADLVREPSPARVTFRTNRRWDAPDLGIVHDDAYWVRDIVPAAEGDAVVDLVSHACRPETERATSMAPLDAGTDPVPWTASEALDAGARELPHGTGVTGIVENVRALTIDVAAACGATSADVRSVDGSPVAVTFA